MFNTLSDKFYYVIGQRRANKLKCFLHNKGDLKKILAKNSEFYNIHEGKRCFIIGNGPSISKIDFKLLKDEYTFTVNQFSRFKNFEDININYHVFSDERIFCFDEKNKGDLEALEYLKKLDDFSPNAKFFSKINSKKYIDNSKFFSNLDVNYYYDGLVFHKGYELDYDITKQIPWFPTCVDYCIFIAMYMGFKEIYLLGCECTGFLKVSALDDCSKDNFSYGYKVTANEGKRIKKQLLDYGIGDELEVWSKILRYYDYMEEFSSKRDVKIVNLTEGGLLYSFERGKLDDILNS